MALKIVAIDGAQGVDRSAVAGEVSRRLGWRLLDWPGESDPGPALIQELRASAGTGLAVAEGNKALESVFPDAEWKFYFDADPRVTNAMPRQENGLLGPLPTGTMLIDTTGFSLETLASMITAVITGETEAPRS